MQVLNQALYDVNFEFYIDGEKHLINIVEIAEYYERIEPPVTIIKQYKSPEDKNNTNITEQKMTMHVGEIYSFLPFRKRDPYKIKTNLWKFLKEINAVDNHEAPSFTLYTKHVMGRKTFICAQPFLEGDEVFQDIETLRQQVINLVKKFEIEIRQNFYFLKINRDYRIPRYDVSIYAPQEFVSFFCQVLHVGILWSVEAAKNTSGVYHGSQLMSETAKQFENFGATEFVVYPNGNAAMIQRTKNIIFETIEDLLDYLKTIKNDFRSNRDSEELRILFSEPSSPHSRKFKS